MDQTKYIKKVSSMFDPYEKKINKPNEADDTAYLER